MEGGTFHARVYGGRYCSQGFMEGGAVHVGFMEGGAVHAEFMEGGAVHARFYGGRCCSSN
jgi:hypothetical protein